MPRYLIVAFAFVHIASEFGRRRTSCRPHLFSMSCGDEMLDLLDASSWHFFAIEHSPILH